mmetsp:Transcript_33287/g.107683  ORF Transcript_33287/g.107683 Transcript_33287/m.107683 type:complete len:340 (+) Transcript_33287:64-1083(+)
MSARTRSAPYIERSEHLHASCNSQHDELSDFLNERKRTQRRPRNSIEHPQPQNYPVFAQHVRVMAMSEWKRIEDLVVDKLEADVGNGAQKQVAADEEVDRFDRPADAATHLTHGAQHAKAEDSKYGRRVVAIGLPDLFQRRHDARRRLVEQCPDALWPVRLLDNRLRHIVLQRPPANAADQPNGEANEDVRIRGNDGHDLGGSDEDEVGGDGENDPCQEGLDRLVQRQDPREPLLLHKWDDCLVGKRLDHTKLQPDTKQTTRDERRVLLVVLRADDRHDKRLAEAVQPVAGRADRLERAGVKGRLCDGVLDSLRIEVHRRRISTTHAQEQLRRPSERCC